MPKTAPVSPTIVGDVAVDSVVLNAKGGSLSAIIKKPIRGDWHEGVQYFGANMEFDEGLSGLFMAPGTRVGNPNAPAPVFHVRRLSAFRYMIELESNDREVIDPVTHATLQILEQMQKAKQVTFARNDAYFSSLPSHIGKTDVLVETAQEKLKGIRRVALKGRIKIKR